MSTKLVLHVKLNDHTDHLRHANLSACQEANWCKQFAGIDVMWQGVQTSLTFESMCMVTA